MFHIEIWSLVFHFETHATGYMSMPFNFPGFGGFSEKLHDYR